MSLLLLLRSPGPNGTATPSAITLTVGSPALNAYRYWRVRVTALNSGTTPTDLAQFAEWNFLSGGSRIVPVSVVGLDDVSSSEGPDKIDNNNSTTDKWLTTLSGMQAMWDFGVAVTPDAYRWYTANDSTTRDPISWVVEASNDKNAWYWTPVHTVTSYAVTASRNTLVNTWSIAPSIPGVPPTRTGVQWRYWRFTPTARSGGGSGLTQYAELHMMSQGLRVPSVAQSGPVGPGANGVDKTDDWSLNTKLVATLLTDAQLTLDLGSSQFCDAYRWYTGNDAADRDPISWTLEGSNDNSSWTTVDTQTSVTITANRSTLAFSGAISASTNGTATPTAVVMAGVLSSATLSGGATASPTAVTLVSVVPSPTVRGSSNTTPAAVVRTVVVPTPTSISGDARAPPSAVALAAVAPAPSVSGASSTSPSAITMVVVVPAPSVSGSGNGTATPGAVALSAVVPAPSTSGAASSTPAAVVRVVSVPAPSAAAGASTTPAAVTRSAVAPAPSSVTGSGVASPVVVTPVVVVPTSFRPFASTSAWNTPTAGGTVWYDHDVLHITDPISGDTFRHWYVNEESFKIWHASPTDTVCTFDLPDFIDIPFHRNRPATTFTFRCPDDAVIGTDVDKLFFVVDDATGDYVELWQGVRTGNTFTAPGGGWSIGNMYTGSGMGDLTNNAGVRAANSSWAAGLITGADLAANKIDHALAIMCGYSVLSNVFWRAPATAPDNGGHSGPIEMGTRLGVPAGVSAPSGLSTFGLALFNALQTYGGFVVDFAGSAYPMFTMDSGTITPGDTRIRRLYTWWDGWTADMDLIGPLIRAADYQPGAIPTAGLVVVVPSPTATGGTNNGTASPAAIVLKASLKFKPTDVAGMQRWYDASLGFTTDRSTAGVNLTAVGSPGAGTRNGLTTVTLNGTSQVYTMGTALPVPDAGFSAFIVMRAVVSGSDKVMVGGSASAAYEWRISGGDDKPDLLRSHTTDAGSASTAVSTPWRVLSVTSSTTLRSFFLDKLADGTNTSTVGSFGDIDRIGAGFSGSTTDWFSGEIAEVILYNVLVSPTDRAAIENYLYDKWFTVATSGGATASPAAITRTVVAPPPAGNGTATPAAVTPTVAVPAPTTSGSSSTTPSAVARSVVVPAPALAAGSNTAPATVTPTVSVPAPTASGTSSGNATPAAVARSAVVPAPTVTGTANTSPSAVALVAVAAAPTGSAASNTSPAAIVRSVVVPAPTVSVSVAPTPAAIVRTVVAPAPAISGGASTTPAAVALVAVAPAPSTSGSGAGTANPAAVVRTVVVPSPSTSGAGTVFPAAVVRAVVVPAAVVSGSTGATPSTVVSVVVAPAPLGAGWAITSPASIVRSVVAANPVGSGSASTVPMAIIPTIVVAVPNPTGSIQGSAFPATVVRTVVVPPPICLGGAVAHPAPVLVVVAPTGPNVVTHFPGFVWDRVVLTLVEDRPSVNGHGTQGHVGTEQVVAPVGRVSGHGTQSRVTPG